MYSSLILCLFHFLPLHSSLSSSSTYRLFSLPESLASEPAYSFECSLAYLMPTGKFQNLAPLDWTARTTTLFKSVTSNDGSSPLRMKVGQQQCVLTRAHHL